MNEEQLNNIRRFVYSEQFATAADVILTHAETTGEAVVKDWEMFITYYVAPFVVDCIEEYDKHWRYLDGEKLEKDKSIF